MTTTNTPATHLSDIHDAELRALASRTRAVEMKQLWGSICNAIVGKFRNEEQQPVFITREQVVPMAYEEGFQRAA